MSGNTLISERFAFGAIPDDRTKPSLEFEAIRRRVTEGGPEEYIPAEAFPTSLDNLSKSVFERWNVLGNKTTWVDENNVKRQGIGNCTAVAWANQRRLVSKLLGGNEVYPELKHVVEVYRAGKGNDQFDAYKTDKDYGPGSPYDNGMSIQEALNFLRKNGGGPDRVKPVAFARVNQEDPKAMKDAMAIFGSLWISFQCLGYKRKGEEDKWPKVFDWAGFDGTAFVNDPKAEVAAGHSVILAGYENKRMRCVSWGELREMDENYIEASRVYDVWAVIWPEHVGTRNFMRGVDLTQLYAEIKRLQTTEPLVLPPAPYSDVFFLKTGKTKSGKVEVYAARAKHSFSDPPNSSESKIFTSPITLASLTKTDILDVDNGDLYLIKTANTSSGNVELQRASAASNYSTLQPTKPLVTGISTSEAPYGKFIIDNSDLYFIKTSNTSHGNVEVSFVTKSNAYQFVATSTAPNTAAPNTTTTPDSAKPPAPEFKLTKTTFSTAEAANGTFAVLGSNIFFIKTRNTTSRTVELYLFRAVDNYTKPPTYYSTSFPVEEGGNGTWDVGPNRDLYFLKQRGDKSKGFGGKTEVHVLKEKVEGQQKKYVGRAATYATWVGEEEGREGIWRAR